MPSDHLNLCCPILSSCLWFFPASGSFPISQFFVIRWPKYWSFSFSISPSNEHWSIFIGYIQLEKAMANQYPCLILAACHFGTTWKREGSSSSGNCGDFCSKLWRELWPGRPLITGHGMDKILFGDCWGRRAVQRDTIHPEHLKLRYESYTASDWNMPYIPECETEQIHGSVQHYTPLPQRSSPLQAASHVRNLMWHVSGRRAPAGVCLVMVNDSLKQYRAGQPVYLYWI